MVDDCADSRIHRRRGRNPQVFEILTSDNNSESGLITVLFPAPTNPTGQRENCFGGILSIGGSTKEKYTKELLDYLYLWTAKNLKSWCKRGFSSFRRSSARR